MDFARHALEGMAKIAKKKCAGDRYVKYSVYSAADSRKPEHSTQDAAEDMVPLAPQQASVGRSIPKTTTPSPPVSQTGGADDVVVSSEVATSADVVKTEISILT